MTENAQAEDQAADDADTDQPAGTQIAIDADEVLIDTVTAEDEGDPAPATDADPKDD